MEQSKGGIWREPNDFPKETDVYLVEVIQRPNDPGSIGATSIHPTYVKFIAGEKENWWMNPPENYKVHRWLDESSLPPSGRGDESGLYEALKIILPHVSLNYGGEYHREVKKAVNELQHLLSSYENKINSNQ